MYQCMWNVNFYVWIIIVCGMRDTEWTWTFNSWRGRWRCTCVGTSMRGFDNTCNLTLQRGCCTLTFDYSCCTLTFTLRHLHLKYTWMPGRVRGGGRRREEKGRGGGEGKPVTCGWGLRRDHPMTQWAELGGVSWKVEALISLPRALTRPA